MRSAHTKTPLFLATLAALVFAVTSLFAQADYTLTGSAIRVKTIAFIDINVYQISHYMKQLPPTRSRQAVIEMDTDKKFVWTMMREVDHDKIINALKEAYEKNGYKDTAKIGQCVSAFKGDLKDKSHVSIVYDANKKTTTVTVDGGGVATIPGVDFMKATWSIWLGKIDQAKMADQLISKIP